MTDALEIIRHAIESAGYAVTFSPITEGVVICRSVRDKKPRHEVVATTPLAGVSELARRLGLADADNRPSDPLRGCPAGEFGAHAVQGAIGRSWA